MNRKSLSFLILFFLFLLIFTEIGYCMEVDGTAVVTSIVDGDTFDIHNDDTIRIADIDSPEIGEQGGQEARDFLGGWIYGKTVYLDIDDIYQFDTTGTRIVCVVYVYYNTTHLLNVNKLLVDEGNAVIDDHDNEFDPDSWSLYVLNPTSIPSSSPTPTRTPSPTPTTSPPPSISPTPIQTPQPSTTPIDPIIIVLLIVIVILGSGFVYLLFKKK